MIVGINIPNSTTGFPNFGSVQTVKFTYDVYTNDRLHRVCFSTVSTTVTVFYMYKYSTDFHGKKNVLFIHVQV